MTIDLRLAAHALYARADAQRSHFEYQSIAGNDWATKTRFLDAGKQNEFLIAIFDFTQCQHGANLRERLDHQHTRHHGRAGKVALKEQLVDTDLFNADDSFARHELDNSIDEEKGITVRQEFLNGLCVENCFHWQSTEATKKHKRHNFDFVLLVRCCDLIQVA